MLRMRLSIASASWFLSHNIRLEGLVSEFGDWPHSAQLHFLCWFPRAQAESWHHVNGSNPEAVKILWSLRLYFVSTTNTTSVSIWLNPFALYFLLHTFFSHFISILDCAHIVGVMKSVLCSDYTYPTICFFFFFKLQICLRLLTHRIRIFLPQSRP